MAPLSAYLFCSLAIFSFVSADSSTINLVNPGVGLEPLYASVAGSVRLPKKARPEYFH